MIDPERLLSQRARDVDVSGIRRAFQLGASLPDPINLSIGQPDFAVPDVLCDAAIEAIRAGRNGYTLTGGADDLRDAIQRHLQKDVGWDTAGDDLDVLVTSGTSGALVLAFMALCGPGTEAIIPDPWFVVYPALGPMTGATIVPCDTYGDFRMTAARVEPLINDRTRIVLVNSPGNPTGVVLTEGEMRDLADLCEQRGVMLVSDEIYDLFTYSDARPAEFKCPSPARHSKDMLLIRGFGKTYGCTGWRLGWTAGPSWLISQMAKFQQYSFVCAPSMAQAAMVKAFDVDMSAMVDTFESRRDMVRTMLGDVTSVSECGGAFYAFVEVPERLGMSGTEFSEAAIERNVVTIPGGVFSSRDTHIRISFACADDKLKQGLEILRSLMTTSPG
ncbi:MAG: aminotransferase class I/II-fold pyridoxal phosphate-dependent enzyme [Phycisphaerales bacterium]|nr:aminotransferase class I/II-fold pyridoxal phosphate-dependent enzyme [Phycisphaerales bacterium]